ncbi:MAG: type II secretion system secretin GspD [Candidatus Binatia bacterium]
MKARIILLVSSVFLILAGMMAGYVLAGQAPGQPQPRETAKPPAGPEQKIPSSIEPEAVPPSTVVQDDKVSLNFSGADLVEVVHVLAQHLKLNYTIDPRVNGTVTIFSAEPIQRENLLPVFHKILRMNNAVAVRSGDLYRIAPIKEGLGMARPVKHAAEDSYALQVVPVRFFSVAELKKLLTPFVAPGGEILDFPRGNFLIIVDLPSNIKRLLEIKELIDVSVFTGVRMEIYEPRISTAEELAEEMTKIMQAYASSALQQEGFAAQFIPIPRINRLLVISHSEAAWTYVKRWIERIDVAAEGPGRRIFIYPVENGKATDLADLLNQIYGAYGATPGREAPPTLRELHGNLPRDPRSLIPTPGSQGSFPGAQGPGAYAVAPAPVPVPPQARRLPATPAEPLAPPAGAEEGIRIVADPATNSLVVFATAQEFQNIREVLKKLDLVPRQVLMDVLVAEITLTDDLKFGVQYAYQEGGLGNFAGTVLPGSEFINQGAIWGSSGLTAVITSGNNFRAVISALMSDSRVKVLSHPSILALDNRPARIQVGSEEPIATGTITAAVGQVSSSTTIQYRNLGNILTIIPQVNSQGLVHLQVKVEVSKRGSPVIIGQDSFSSFVTRDAETTAVVQDGDTLVIGGIIDERFSRDRIGIPFLMDIPVLGQFFRVDTDDFDRTELVILITPHVIRNRNEAKNVTDKYIDSLSSVKRELEKMKRQKEKSVSKEPPLITPDKESGLVPKEGAYVVPQALPREPKSPIKGINFASRVNGGGSQFGPESVEEMTESTTDPDEYASAEAPGIDFGKIWRVLLKILTFGLL